MDQGRGGVRLPVAGAHRSRRSRAARTTRPKSSAPARIRGGHGEPLGAVPAARTGTMSRSAYWRCRPVPARARAGGPGAQPGDLQGHGVAMSRPRSRPRASSAGGAVQQQHGRPGAGLGDVEADPACPDKAVRHPVQRRERRWAGGRRRRWSSRSRRLLERVAACFHPGRGAAGRVGSALVGTSSSSFIGRRGLVAEIVRALLPQGPGWWSRPCWQPGAASRATLPWSSSRSWTHRRG
jgi:hypothetical protein